MDVGQKNFKKDNPAKFLLLLENVEDIISHDQGNFKKLLKDVYESCEHLSIIMCSYEWVGRVSDSIMPTIINILELDPVSSVKLFMECTGEFKPEEIVKLILYDPKSTYLQALLPDLALWMSQNRNQLTEDQKQYIFKALRGSSREMRIKVLSQHDLFHQLNGNPYSISTLAAFYKNPFVEDNDLVGIYKRLLNSSECFSRQSQDDFSAGTDLNAQKPVLNHKTSP